MSRIVMRLTIPVNAMSLDLDRRTLTLDDINIYRLHIKSSQDGQSDGGTQCAGLVASVIAN